jgi:hypothetical protein
MHISLFITCPGFGNSFPQKCDPSSYADEEGQSLCSPCPIGYVCPGRCLHIMFCLYMLVATKQVAFAFALAFALTFAVTQHHHSFLLFEKLCSEYGMTVPVVCLTVYRCLSYQPFTLHELLKIEYVCLEYGMTVPVVCPPGFVCSTESNLAPTRLCPACFVSDITSSRVFVSVCFCLFVVCHRGYVLERKQFGADAFMSRLLCKSLVSCYLLFVLAC